MVDINWLDLKSAPLLQGEEYLIVLAQSGNLAVMKLKGPIGPHRTHSALVENERPEENPDLSLYSNDGVHPDYDSLPEGIKIAFSPRDYFVMPDEEKKTLLFDIMNPEVGED